MNDTNRKCASHASQAARPVARLRLVTLVAGLLLAQASSAQNAPDLRLPVSSGPQTGLHYYAVENLDTGRIEQRGIAGSQGVAFANLILAPNTPYRVWILQAETLAVADRSFITPENGESFEVPSLSLRISSSGDRDGDGLHDEAERILGTIDDPENPQSRDSDGDGILDGAEVVEGLDPLDGFPVRSGIIGSADSPGTAIDVCARNDVVSLADSERGVTVFNVFNGMEPLRIAQVNSGDRATAVACGDGFVAVAEGDAVVVIDLTDPPAAFVRFRRTPGSPVRSVATAGGVVYAGLGDGRVAAFDAADGALLGEARAAGPVDDLGIEGDLLFAVAGDRLVAFALPPFFPEQLGSVPTSALVADPFSKRKRLSVGGGIARVTAFPGFDSIEVNDPLRMRPLASAGGLNVASFKQIVANGSGLGVAALGVAPRGGGMHHVSLFDLSDPADTTAFLTTFETPGLCSAVAIYDGIAYAADGEAGLQVINYEAYDVDGIPPEIELSFNFAVGFAEEGQPIRVTAAVSDDVQVRNVEFYVDGVRDATDGNFPFEHRFRAPLRREQSSLTIQARASDTGGNATFSEIFELELVPDATPPRVTRVTPKDNSLFVEGLLDVLSATFSEALDPATTDGALTLFSAGPDGAIGSADDEAVGGGEMSYRDEAQALFLSFGNAIPGDSYRAVVSASIADLAGNPLPASFAWDFLVYSDVDSDGDGVPDELERLLGLDPELEDSDGDGTADGLEDFDEDGLPNRGEVELGVNPTVEDSDADGTLDGDEDTDFDLVKDGDEIRNGTDPRLIDTDGDGFADIDERRAGTDPRDDTSVPRAAVDAAESVVASYLNALPGKPGSQKFTSSQVVTYENQ